MSKKIAYQEPDDYFPESVRKMFGLGEYNKEEDEKEQKEREKMNKDFRDYVEKKNKNG